ncbi:MAG: histidine phosphatase family protein [Myxococcota bacterium]
MRLYLLRHARAEIVGDAARDDSRGLTEEGLREAAGVGSWLSTRSEPPTHVLCSPARRAVETMERVIAALLEKPATSISEDLYLGSAWKLFEKVRGTEPGVSSLMLVGHNPGIAELANKLSGHGDPAALRSLARRFPPATLAELEPSAASWSAFEPAGARLVSHFVA